MKTFAKTLLYLLVLAVAAGAIHQYGFRPLGENLPSAMQHNFQLHPFGIYMHIAGALVALLLGPLQFWRGLRQRLPRLHRWTGRVYLGVGVLCGGLAGLYMALHAFGGPIAQAGFACLALCWLYTGFKGYQAIRAGQVEQHRRWMLRNFSLTLAAVSLRVYLPLSMMAGLDFVACYQVIAWMCWIPNLLLAEMLQASPARNAEGDAPCVLRNAEANAEGV